MADLLIFNKPFQVLSQFTDDRHRQPRATLADWIQQPGFYPAGRLDYDSEGLLLLTNEGALQHRIASPTNKMPKTYWVQVEGDVPPSAIEQLSHGVALKDGATRPAKAKRMQPPDVWQRTPPVRHRESVPTSWLELTITEGRNRQVRRMTAAVGYPTLRLIRYRIGDWSLDDLQPGDYRQKTVYLPESTKARRKPVGERRSPRRQPSPHKGAR